MARDKIRSNTRLCNPFSKQRGYRNTLKESNINKLAKNRKFELVKRLTSTDLEIVNSAEPFRVSSYNLLKFNLIDPVLYILVAIAFTSTSLLLAVHDSSLASVCIMFAIVFIPLHYHIESYRSFCRVKRSVEILSHDDELRSTFLRTHLPHNTRAETSAKTKVDPSKMDDIPDGQRKAAPKVDTSKHAVESKGDSAKNMLPIVRNELVSRDSFKWANILIGFFWPYLSHLIHYELNDFFRDQIDSGKMANSKEGSKRVFYAVLKLLDTKILAIERCQLGKQVPKIKNIAFHKISGLDKKIRSRDITPPTLLKSESKAIMESSGCKESSKKSSERMVYDFRFEYNGDMNISFIYRYFYCCATRMGLKDIFLRFHVRIILGPVKAKSPFIEEIMFTFLELPEFGYKGIAIAELSELKVVRSVINAVISENLLYPRAMSVRTSKLMDTIINRRLPMRPKKTDISNKKTPENTPQVSFFTRLAARSFLCGCMCSNILLRSCQRRRKDEEKKTDDNSSGDGSTDSTGSYDVEHKR